MNMQQIQTTLKNVQRTTGNPGLWLGLGILLIVAALAIQEVSRPAPSVTNAGSPSQAQSVPEAAVQSVTAYLQAHSNPAAQTVPEASVQSAADYIRVHSNSSAQAVPEAVVQSVTDYIRLHSNDPSTILITDPSAQSVMDYLKAHK